MKPLLTEIDPSAKALMQEGVQYGGYVSNKFFNRIEYYAGPEHPGKCTCIYFVPYENRTAIIAYLPALHFVQDVQARNDEAEWQYFKQVLPLTYMLWRNKDTEYPFMTAWKDVEDPLSKERTTVLGITIDAPFEPIDENAQDDDNDPELDKKMELFFTAVEDLQKECTRFLSEAAKIQKNQSGLSPEAKMFLKGLTRVALAMFIGDMMCDIDLDLFDWDDDGGLIADSDGYDSDYDDAYDDGDTTGSSDISFTGSKDDKKLKKLKDDLDYNIHQANISNDPTKWCENAKDTAKKIKSMTK